MIFTDQSFHMLMHFIYRHRLRPGELHGPRQAGRRVGRGAGMLHLLLTLSVVTDNLQAKDEQISDFIRGQYKSTTGKDFPVSDKDTKLG